MNIRSVHPVSKNGVQVSTFSLWSNKNRGNDMQGDAGIIIHPLAICCRSHSIHQPVIATSDPMPAQTQPQHQLLGQM